MSKRTSRKAIQIAVATDGQPDTNSVLVVLFDDGTIWKQWANGNWKRVDTSAIEKVVPQS